MTSALHLRGLRKAYGAVQAVNGLDLDVTTGECFGLLGPNGAGKTTTIEICEGLKPADHGDVMVLGRHWTTDARWLRAHIGVSLQETQFSDKLTVRETVLLFRSFYAKGPPADSVLAQVSLGEKRDARVLHLSGGQKQRLALACALVGDPELLFLDEPTTGLDPQSRRQLWNLIEGFKAAGRTTILTTHYMDEAERLCDRVAIVDQGRVIALGTPRELIASLGADQVIECVVGSDPSAARLVCAAVAGVQEVTVEERTLRLPVKALHVTLPAVLEALQRAGLDVVELRTHAPTLEDVFVALTGRHLRDG